MTDVAIIGGGPAGLIAAEHLASAGLAVTIFDRMPSLGRKFLMAGRGGLNLTHSEDFETFLTRYGPLPPQLDAALRAFRPTDLRDWAHGLGEETFVGSSGRVFPQSFKASPLLRAWLRRLDGLGVTVRTRTQWKGWTADGALLFDSPEGEFSVAPKRATLLALGGASWPKLGSDGVWTEILAARGIGVAPLNPSNAGVRIDWSETFRQRFAGEPVKRIALGILGGSVSGEMTVTETGLEGGAIYALSRHIRAALESGTATLSIDLRPDLTATDIEARLSRPRKGETDSNFLRKAMGLSPVQIGLLRESFGKKVPAEPAALAKAIKTVSLNATGMEGLPRAISTAGGLRFDALTPGLELKALPGVFAAGEMLDWEAPTGGYLLQASFATGVLAARQIILNSKL